MPEDRFSAHNRNRRRRLPKVPDDFADWKGMRMPRARAFSWRDLVRVAAVNGFDLSHALVHKWRVWRFLPPPTAGGAVGRGPGKGEVWSKEAGRLVAWISYFPRINDDR